LKTNINIIIKVVIRSAKMSLIGPTVPTVCSIGYHLLVQFFTFELSLKKLLNHWIRSKSKKTKWNSFSAPNKQLYDFYYAFGQRLSATSSVNSDNYNSRLFMVRLYGSKPSKPIQKTHLLYELLNLVYKRNGLGIKHFHQF